MVFRSSIPANERGEGKISLIITLAIFGIAIFVATKMIPVKIHSYALGDYIREEAQRAAWTRDAATLRKHILEKAQLLELNLDEKNIDITFTAGEVRVQASYVVPVDLKFKRYDWAFQQEETAPLF